MKSKCKLLVVLDTTFQLRARSGVHYCCYYSQKFYISVSIILVITTLKLGSSQWPVKCQQLAEQNLPPHFPAISVYFPTFCRYFQHYRFRHSRVNTHPPTSPASHLSLVTCSSSALHCSTSYAAVNVNQTFTSVS